MTDLAVSARFLRAMQPIQYEKAEAEITVSGAASSPAEVAAFMDQAQRVALAAVGKSHEFRSASPGNVIQDSPSRPAAPSGEPTQSDVGSTQGGPEPSTPEKPPARRGRPPKADKQAETPPTQDALEAALSDAAGKPEPDAAKLAGVDPEPKAADKDLPPVTDEELQTACANAAEKITAEKVRALYKDNYRVSRVAEIEQDFRRPFLKDLSDLLAKSTKA